MRNVVILAWSKLSRRTRDLAQWLGAQLLFIKHGSPYVKAWMETKRLLFKLRPRIVIAQLPPGPLLFRLVWLSRNNRFRLVADVHTGFVVYKSFKEVILNAPFRKFLYKVDLVLSHNPLLTDLITRRLKLERDKVLTVYDPLPKPLFAPKNSIGVLKLGSEYILVPSSWSPDEPLSFIVREFVASKVSRNYKLVISGNKNRRRRLAERLVKEARGKLILTGYLKDEYYYALLGGSTALITATSREYTMLSGLWEAVAYNKIALVSETFTLKSILGKEYPCFFSFKKGGLARTLDRCVDHDSEIIKMVEKTFNNLSRRSEKSLNILKKRLEELV